MRSTTKAIATGAIALVVIGGPSGAATGAETADRAPTWVTGTIAPSSGGSSCSPGTSEIDGDVTRVRGTEYRYQQWTSSDPRLTGAVVRRWNTDTYSMDGGPTSVETGSAWLRNDGGGWVCSDIALLTGSGMDAVNVTGTSYVLSCVGDGGYDGLSAILGSEMSPTFDEAFVGLIFAGDVPPLPAAPDDM